MKKNASESNYILERIYGVDQVLDQKWFKRFKNGNFDLEDAKHIEPSKKFEDENLKEILNENSPRTQKELANILGVTQQAISHHLKVLGMTRKAGKCLSLSKNM